MSMTGRRLSQNRLNHPKDPSTHESELLKKSFWPFFDVSYSDRGLPMKISRTRPWEPTT